MPARYAIGASPQTGKRLSFNVLIISGMLLSHHQPRLSGHDDEARWLVETVGQAMTEGRDGAGDRKGMHKKSAPPHDGMMQIYSISYDVLFQYRNGSCEFPDVF